MFYVNHNIIPQQLKALGSQPAEIGSGVVWGGPEVRFQEGSTSVPPAFHKVLRWLRGGASTKKSTACCWGYHLSLCFVSYKMASKPTKLMLDYWLIHMLAAAQASASDKGSCGGSCDEISHGWLLSRTAQSATSGSNVAPRLM